MLITTARLVGYEHLDFAKSGRPKASGEAPPTNRLHSDEITVQQSFEIQRTNKRNAVIIQALVLVQIKSQSCLFVVQGRYLLIRFI